MGLRTIRLLIAALLLFVAACSSPPTVEPEQAAPADSADPTGSGAPEGTGSETEAAQGDADPFAPVLVELKGLEGEARTDRLVELAEEEGELNVYTSNTDLSDFADTFGDSYDVDVSVYRARANQVLQRILQESQAQFPGNDFVDTNAEELTQMVGEDLLVDYQGPAEEGLDESALQDGWTGSRLNVYAAAWNTDEFGGDQAPASYEDFTDERFRGRLLVESRAYEWYMALSDYYVEQGQTQEEVDALMEDIVANATLIEGNTIQAQYLSSGEFGASANVYNHLVEEERVDGAPVNWAEPLIEPVVVRPNGQGLMRTAQHPAAALLFFEWLLTEGQPLLVEQYRVPARTDEQGGALEGVERAVVDVQKLVEEGPDWEARYDELLTGALGQAQSDG